MLRTCSTVPLYSTTLPFLMSEAFMFLSVIPAKTGPWRQDAGMNAAGAPRGERQDGANDPASRNVKTDPGSAHGPVLSGMSASCAHFGAILIAPSSRITLPFR